MEELLRFLEQYEAWIYALLGVVGFIYFRKLIGDWQEWRSSVFGLERESAQRRLSATLAVVVVITLLASAEFLLVSFVAPVYPVANVLQTPTINVMTTPTTELFVDGQSQPEESVALATQAAVISGDCDPSILDWSYPQAGEEVSGVVKLVGTANLSNMGFFKYEFSEVGSDSWVTIAAMNVPLNDEELDGSWNTQALIPGDYRLRLVMTNNENQTLPACEITVRVVPPPED
jgi:hypothetical protein